MKAKAIFVAAEYGSAAIRKFCHKRTEQACKQAGVGLVYQKQPTDWKLCHASIYRNIIAGVKQAMDCDTVYICEHDCIYPASYFTEHLSDTCPYKHYSFSTDMEYLTADGFVKRPYVWGAMSTMVGTPKAIIEGVQAKLNTLERDGAVMWAEPSDGKPIRKSTGTVIDIRHSDNFTGKRQGAVIRKDEARALWEEIGI